MKSVACYKKSASSTNVWLFNFCRIASLLFLCIPIYFMQLMKFTILLNLLISLSLIKIVFSRGSFSGADRAQEKQF